MMEATRETAPEEVMEKEAIVKEDGRELIYYRFRPESEAPRSEEAR